MVKNQSPTIASASAEDNSEQMFVFVVATTLRMGASNETSYLCDHTGQAQESKLMELLMGLFRMAVFQHGGVPENSPLALIWGAANGGLRDGGLSKSEDTHESGRA